jgi:LCP family protein required for cell wall assembly
VSTPPTSGPVLPPELDPRGPRGPHRPAPPPYQRRPPARRPVARTLSWLAVIGSVLVLLVSVTGYALFVHYDGNINRLPIFKHNSAAADGKGVNYLIVGSDTRALPGDTKYQAAPGSADYVTGERSDTVMLVHIPGGKTARATVVSFPRDTFVQIPSYTDKRGRHDAQLAKLNAAFAFGGPALLVQTIEGLTGLRVDHYVQVDFSGFKNMVNSLGGVTLCIGTSRNDKDSGDFLTKGVHHVNGDQALAFVRDRKGLPNGDFDRIRDQQYFLSVVMHKVLSAGTLSQPWKINSFLNSVTKSLTADQDLSFSDMRQLALRMRNLDPSRVEFLTLPNEGDAMRPPYGSVVLVNQSKAKALFERLRTDGKPASAKSTKQPKLVVPPSAVQVAVQNGSGVGGRAVEARNALSGAGFVTLGAQNADRSDYEHSVVRYGSGKKQSAETLAAAVPGATIEEDTSLGSSLVLVVGSDSSGVQAVHVGSTSATATKKATTPAAPKPTEPSVTGASMSCAP